MISKIIVIHNSSSSEKDIQVVQNQSVSRLLLNWDSRSEVSVHQVSLFLPLQCIHKQQWPYWIPMFGVFPTCHHEWDISQRVSFPQLPFNVATHPQFCALLKPYLGQFAEYIPNSQTLKFRWLFKWSLLLHKSDYWHTIQISTWTVYSYRPLWRE